MKLFIKLLLVFYVTQALVGAAVGLWIGTKYGTEALTIMERIINQ